ncbi:MAG: sugar transferase [Thermoleophilia bacterium]
MKRAFDLCVGAAGLLLVSPVLLLFMILVWLQDRKSPFYMAPRIGFGGTPFKMIKLRSMITGADRTGVESTAADDQRITRVGHIIRRYKLDELSQMINVVKGEMSLVGPRPHVRSDVYLYTDEEKKLLTVKPGITDLASIVFADEGEILRGSSDPDLDYKRLIRPWKSRLAILYVEKSSILLDLRILYLSVMAIFSRRRALRGVESALRVLDADDDLIGVARRVKGICK